MSQFINGKSGDALSGRTDVVRDPSNGEVVAEITLAELNGGWRVTGRWPWASGCLHAHWAACGR